MSVGDARARPSVNHWIVALTVTLATFMEVLDTSIANVALPHIAGGLSAGISQATWVLTSYLVANAIVLPLSGWFISRLGRKRYYMGCVFLFTVSSALCGAAPSLPWLIFFRILQGIGGGGLQPSEQGILIDTFPARLRGMAMAIYGVAVVVAPILGPTLGGWITDNYSWRWIFYINVPIGLLSLLLTSFIIHDPPGMAAEVRKNRARGARVDYIGLGLVTIGLGALEVLYAKGQEWDWFNDSHHRAQFFMVACPLALVLLVIWELRHPNPILNLRLLMNRQFFACGLIVFASFAALYGINALLPQMLQELFGYDATQAGLILSPAAIFTMAAMPVVGFLLGKGVDARYLIPFGLALLVGGSYWTAHLSFAASPWALLEPRCVILLGMGFLFVPLNDAAYIYIPKDQINNATGLFNMFRNEGASFGIAIGTTLLARRTQFHHARLAENIHPGNPAYERTLDALTQVRVARGGVSMPEAGQQAMGLIEGMVSDSSRLMAYLDAYWVYAMLGLAVFPCVLLMRRSVSKGDVVAG